MSGKWASVQRLGLRVVAEQLLPPAEAVRPEVERLLLARVGDELLVEVRLARAQVVVAVAAAGFS